MNWYQIGSKVFVLTLKDKQSDPSTNGYVCLEFYKGEKPKIEIWSIHCQDIICLNVPEEYLKLANEIISVPLFEIELEKFLINDKN